jgi:hypothetical protein
MKVGQTSGATMSQAARLQFFIGCRVVGVAIANLTAKPVARTAQRLQWQHCAEFRPKASYVDINRSGPTFVLVAPHFYQEVLAREDFAAPFAEIRQQTEFLRRQCHGPAVDCDFVPRLVDHNLTELLALFGSKLASAPFESANPAIELPGYVRVQAEIVESTPGLDASHLANTHGDDGSDFVKNWYPPNRLKCRYCQVGAVEGFEKKGSRPDVQFVVVLFEQFHRIIPQIQRAHCRTQLAQRRCSCVIPVHVLHMSQDTDELLGSFVSSFECLAFH